MHIPSSSLRAARKLVPLAILTLSAAGAARAGSIEIFGAPADAYSSLSSAGTWATSYNGDGISILNADRSTTIISPNSPTHGYGGSPSMSADGRYVATVIGGSDGTSQAGVYDRNTASWNMLGSLNGAYVRSGDMKQSSVVTNISADGSTVMGSSAFSATPGAQTDRYHGTVWRNGQIYDVTGSSATAGSGRILSSNADGTVVVGYVNNNDRDSSRIWTWNGNGYSASPTPTATNPFTGATGQHVQLDAVSANGNWIAGGSSRNMGSNSYGGFGNAITFLQPTLWNVATQTMTVIPYDHVVDTDLSNDVDGSKLQALANDVDKNAIATIVGVTDEGLVFGSFTFCIDVHCNISLSNQDTFVYSALTGQSVTFDSFMASQGVALSPSQHVWDLFSVASDGSAVSGYLFDTATNTTSSFILHISAVPEPGSWALLVLGLPMLLGLRQRRTR